MRYNTILLIDDDRDDRDFFADALKRISVETTLIAMEDAAVALQRCETREIIPDVIVLDLNMPGMKGEEFLIQIKKNNQLKDIPVFILTTSSLLSTIETMKSLGAAEFYTKPNALIDLVGILKKVFEG